MPQNYIFSGFGHAAGDYAITNDDLYSAVQKGQLQGFNEQLVLQSKNYQEYIKTNPSGNPFDYFVGHKMGFYRRCHVAPWPPTREHQSIAPTSLDLLIKAVEMAIKDSNIDPEEIDGWIVSTVSPHEYAPGVAATLKSYFVKPTNSTPAMTLTSGCAGFNKGLKRAIEHFKANQHKNRILVAHAETMSHFLTNNNNFVWHSTFGDAAAAVVISRQESHNYEGIIADKLYHDVLMIDSVGVDKDKNLYMDGAWVKNRAIANICKASIEVIEESRWNNNDIDLIVPHQTGNAILHGAAQALGIQQDKLYQQVQQYYGNVSGVTIPLSLSLLKHEGKLLPGMRLICPTAGVGGEYGAFTYVVPKERKNVPKQLSPLRERSAMVFFADSPLGILVCEELLRSGAKVTAHANRENYFSMHLASLEQTTSDFKLSICTLHSPESVDNYINHFGNQKFDYCINLFSAKETIYGIINETDSIQWSQVNEHISRRMISHTTATTLILGHPIEMAAHYSANSLKILFSGWHGLMGSMSGEAASKGVRVVWYTPGVYDDITPYMDYSLKQVCREGINQINNCSLDLLAVRLVKSLYLVKVSNTKDIFKNAMVSRAEIFAFRQ